MAISMKKKNIVCVYSKHNHDSSRPSCHQSFNLNFLTPSLDGCSSGRKEVTHLAQVLYDCSETKRKQGWGFGNKRVYFSWFSLSWLQTQLLGSLSEHALPPLAWPTVSLSLQPCCTGFPLPLPKEELWGWVPGDWWVGACPVRYRNSGEDNLSTLSQGPNSRDWLVAVPPVNIPLMCSLFYVHTMDTVKAGREFWLRTSIFPTMVNP